MFVLVGADGKAGTRAAQRFEQFPHAGVGLTAHGHVIRIKGEEAFVQAAELRLDNGQAVVAQAPLCLKGVAGGTALGAYANTACIEFSSRGLPVAADGSPTANDAMYVTDTNTVYGVTVIISGLIQTWSTPASNTAWEAR